MTIPGPAMSQMTFPELYERWLVAPLFQPWAEVLVDHAQIGARDHVLDIACGTGIVARLVWRRVPEGRVVGVDISAQMLAVAAAIAPEIQWRQGSAEALPVEAGETVDVALCQQGLQFFPDKQAAAAEMHRVLRAGGRLALATWRALDENPFFQELHAIAERHVGTVVDARHGFGDAAVLAGLLAGAGFHDVGVETVSRTIRFEDAAMFFRLNSMALVGMSRAAKTMDDEQRSQAVAAIATESGGLLQRYTDGSTLTFEIRSNIATARA